MLKHESQRHHWWPRCVSREWAATDGRVGRLWADGRIDRLPPDDLGMLRDGHTIGLGASRAEPTFWDVNFEREFALADDAFPRIIKWLRRLKHVSRDGHPLRERFLPVVATADSLRTLTECVVSLAIRGPMNRAACAAWGELWGGEMTKRQRNALIGANMRGTQRVISDSIGANAKFAVLYSRGREFIFGDGFFHNIAAQRDPPCAPKLLVPLTPEISVIITRPLSRNPDPALCTLLLTEDEVDTCNAAVQVYSSDCVFFRSNAPVRIEAFTQRRHARYASSNNPIDTLMREIPGVPRQSEGCILGR